MTMEINYRDGSGSLQINLDRIETSPRLISVGALVPPRSENRQNPLWYFGQGRIAEAVSGNRRVEITVEGEQRMCFEEDGTYFLNDDCLTEAENLLMDDSALAICAAKEDWVDMECSFEFATTTAQGGRASFTPVNDAYAYSYKEAIEMAYSMLTDEGFWEQS